MIPYGRQIIEDDDIQAVVDVLKSDFLTTGPKIAEFEDAFSAFTNSPHAACLSSGTAALHGAMQAIGIGPGDEVIVPTMTFAATANAVVYQGGVPVFADVSSDNLLIDPKSVEQKITGKTAAIVAVDYGGQPCDYDKLADLAQENKLTLIADACHSLGGRYRGQMVGNLADLSVFSFHPVKHIAAGEGGMVTTDDEELAAKIRKFRNHGIASDHHQRQKQTTWYYEMTDLGFNYRLTDIQAALALSQLKKLPLWLERRRQLAAAYTELFSATSYVCPLECFTHVDHAYHLYVVRLDLKHIEGGRRRVFNELRARGIGCNVHYIPVHLHPFYRQEYGGAEGDCANAERAYEEILSLPMHAALKDDELVYIVDSLTDIVGA